MKQSALKFMACFQNHQFQDVKSKDVRRICNYGEHPEMQEKQTGSVFLQKLEVLVHAI